MIFVYNIIPNAPLGGALLDYSQTLYIDKLFGYNSFFNQGFVFVVTILLQEIVIINIGLGVFNLIPLPPLDGSKVLMHFLPSNVKNWCIQYSQVFYIVFVRIIKHNAHICYF